MITAGIIVGTWTLTILTYSLGYEQGKKTGIAQAINVYNAEAPVPRDPGKPSM